MIAGIAVLWAGYTFAWWGWLALTDKVPVGKDNTVWWPSIKDLVIPGNSANVGANTLGARNAKDDAETAAAAAENNAPLTGQTYGTELTNPVMPASLTTPPAATKIVVA